MLFRSKSRIGELEPLKAVAAERDAKLKEWESRHQGMLKEKDSALAKMLAQIGELEPIKGKLADTLIEMEQDVQSSISYSGGKKLMDIRKVNYVTLGGDNAGEHLLM